MAALRCESIAQNEELTMRINYLAVVVCAAVYWLLGGLWYGLLFSARWMAPENMTREQGRGMNTALPYIVTFVLNLLIAYVLAQVCSWRTANTAGRGAAIGVLLWDRHCRANYLHDSHVRDAAKGTFAINEFYPLLGLCLTGAILGAWKKKPA
jgi:hypothetical protein